METVFAVSTVLLWIVMLFNLILTFALVRRVNSGGAKQDGLNVGEQAPNFTASMLSGSPVTKRNYEGRAVTFLFVSPDCGPCREMLFGLSDVNNKAAQVGVELVLVSSGDTRQTQKLSNEFGLELPIIVAPGGSNSFGRKYKVIGTPAFCSLDKRGIVKASGIAGKTPAWQVLVNSWDRPIVSTETTVENEGGETGNKVLDMAPRART